MSARTWSPDVAALGDRIAVLTADQAAALSEYLADVHGLEAAAVAELLPAPLPDVVIEDGQPAPALFSVVLAGYDGGRKIDVIKAVRALLGLGLKGAKELVEAAPCTVKADLPRAEAEAWRDRLEAAGAHMSLRQTKFAERR